MNIKNLIDALKTNKNAKITIELPDGNLVPAHFHVTEVAIINKKFVDCGGVIRKLKNCCLQIWVANDTNHQLVSDKLHDILKKSKKSIKVKNDYEVELEYGSPHVVNYKLNAIRSTPGSVVLNLSNKKTDCLAPDKCGINVTDSKICCSQGCC